jgi:hypothetical protein
VRIPIKATAREPIDRPDTMSDFRYPCTPHLRSAAGSLIASPLSMLSAAYGVTVLSAVDFAAATSGSKRRRCKVPIGLSDRIAAHRLAAQSAAPFAP